MMTGSNVFLIAAANSTVRLSTSEVSLCRNVLRRAFAPIALRSLLPLSSNEPCYTDIHLHRGIISYAPSSASARCSSTTCSSLVVSPRFSRAIDSDLNDGKTHFACRRAISSGSSIEHELDRPNFAAQTIVWTEDGLFSQSSTGSVSLIVLRISSRYH